MTRSRPLGAAIWRRGRACSSAGSRSAPAAAPAPSYSRGRRRHFRLHPPTARPARAAGYQATLPKGRDWRARRPGGGTKGADWRRERGRAKGGGTKASDWRSKWEGTVQKCLAELRNGFGQENGCRVETLDWVGADLGAGT